MKKYVSVILSISVLFLMQSVCWSDDEALKLTVSTDADSYVRGTPVFVRLVLTNTGTAPVTLQLTSARARGIDMSRCFLEVASNEGKFEVVDYREVEAKRPMRRVVLKSGEQLLGDVALWFRARKSNREERRLIFDGQGKNRLRMSCLVFLVSETGLRTSTKVVSDEVEIAISPADRGFEKFLAAAKEYTFDDAGIYPKGLGPLEKVINDHPDSIYAEYAKGLVIKHWCDECDREELWAKVKDDKKLLAWAEEVLAKFGNSRGHLSRDSLYLLSLFHLMEGWVGPESERSTNLKKADEYTSILKQGYPASRRLQVVEDTRVSLERKSGRK